MRAAPLAALLAALPAAAGAFEIRGEPVEGGLITVFAATGTEAALDGVPVPVAPDGTFLVGFHRDTPDRMILRVREPGRPEERVELAVRQRTYREQRIDGLPPDRVTPPVEVLGRIREEARRVREARAVVVDVPYHVRGFAWPVQGCVTGVYGSRRILNGEPRRPHFGVDIALPRGTPVRVPAGGVVVLAEPGLYFSGGTVVIGHGQGLSSSYLHLDAIFVGKWDRVRAGDLIGTVGSTGRSTGPHLDWRFNWMDARLDPELVAGAAPGGCAPPAAAGGGAE